MHASVAVPVMVRETEREAKIRRVTDSETTQVVERQDYIRVPNSLLGVLVAILIALCGTIYNSVTSLATIRADVARIDNAVNGQAATSLQSQINELKTELKTELANERAKEDTDYKTNLERENDTRMRLAAKGIIIK